MTCEKYFKEYYKPTKFINYFSDFHVDSFNPILYYFVSNITICDPL